MAYLLARESRDWEWLFEFNAKVRAMYWSELATAIFKPFRVHGIVFGTVYLSSLERLCEHLDYEVQQLSKEDLRQRIQVTLKQSWDGGIYIHFRAKNKKIFDWGWRLFTMRQGRLERFDNRRKEDTAATYDELESADYLLRRLDQADVEESI